MLNIELHFCYRVADNRLRSSVVWVLPASSRPRWGGGGGVVWGGGGGVGGCFWGAVPQRPTEWRPSPNPGAPTPVPPAALWHKPAFCRRLHAFRCRGAAPHLRLWPRMARPRSISARACGAFLLSVGQSDLLLDRAAAASCFVGVAVAASLCLGAGAAVTGLSTPSAQRP